MSDLKINHLPNGILYIENAFPLSKEFLSEIEEFNNDKELTEVIPSWSEWYDGAPVAGINEDDGTPKWDQVLDYENSHRGVVKMVDWDSSINKNNSLWPRVEVTPDYDASHLKAYKILEKIDKPYQEMLKIWADTTGNELPSTWVTKNYTIRKYKTGGHMGPHVDKNTENPLNSMDWTALIYLNDDYEGGELVFDNLGITLKPSAGSIIFFPCLESHSVNDVTSGNKAYIFLFIHLDVGISTALGESYQGLTKTIKESRGL